MQTDRELRPQRARAESSCVCTGQLDRISKSMPTATTQTRNCRVGTNRGMDKKGSIPLISCVFTPIIVTCEAHHLVAESSTRPLRDCEGCGMRSLTVGVHSASHCARVRLRKSCLGSRLLVRLHRAAMCLATVISVITVTRKAAECLHACLYSCLYACLYACP